MINRKHIDASSCIAQLITASTAGTVPSADSGCTTNVGEVWQGSLGAETLSDESVASVGTGDNVQGAGCIIVSGVVGDGDGEGTGGHGEEGGDGWELHFDCCWFGFGVGFDGWLICLFVCLKSEGFVDI